MVPFLYCWYSIRYYRKISYIRRTLVCNKIVDHSDVVGASPVGAVLMVPGIWYPRYTDNTVSVLMVPGIWYPRYTDNTVSVLMVPGIWYPRYTDNTVSVLMVPGIWYPRYTDNTVSVLMVPGIWYYWYKYSTWIDMKLLLCMNMKLLQTQWFFGGLYLVKYYGWKCNYHGLICSCYDRWLMAWTDL